MLAFNNLKEKDIVIFLNRIDKIEKVDNIFQLARTCYHEVRHSIQQNFDNYSYEGFLRNIDLLRTNKIYYQVEHDSFSFEIGANLYGISKAKEYIKKKLS